jgi:hypothetical protein
MTNEPTQPNAIGEIAIEDGVGKILRKLELTAAKYLPNKFSNQKMH